MTAAHPFVGHAGALSEFRKAFASGRMPHAWLISGIEGIGKATFAKHVAQFVLSEGAGDLGELDPKRNAGKQVDAETHPDLMIVRRTEDEKTGVLRDIISVKEVTKIKDFLHKTSSHGGWRVVIIDEAHALNRTGQNAILKVVEEPPARTLILITVTTPGILLPTIRSRARTLRLSPLDAADMRTLLAEMAARIPAEDMETIIERAGGSIGFALKIVRADVLPLYRDMVALLERMPNLDVAGIHQLADQVSRKADSEAFAVLKTLLLERLRAATHNEAHNYPEGRPDAAIEVWEKTKEVFAMAEASNLDRKAAFITALCGIGNARS